MQLVGTPSTASVIKMVRTISTSSHFRKMKRMLEEKEPDAVERVPASVAAEVKRRTATHAAESASSRRRLHTGRDDFHGVRNRFRRAEGENIWDGVEPVLTREG